MKKQELKSFFLLSLPFLLAGLFGLGFYFLLGRFFDSNHQTYSLTIGFLIMLYAVFKLGMSKKIHYLTLWLGALLILYSGMIVYPNSDILIFRGKQSTLTDSWFVIWPTDFFSHKIKLVQPYQTSRANISVADSTGQKRASGYVYAKFKVDTDNSWFQAAINDSTNTQFIMQINLDKWLNDFSKSVTEDSEITNWLKTKEQILSGENYSLTLQSTRKIINVQLNPATEIWEKLTLLSLNPKEGYVQFVLNQ